MMKKISYILMFIVSVFMVTTVTKATVVCPATSDIPYELTFDDDGKLVSAKDTNVIVLQQDPLKYWNVKDASQCPKTKNDIYIAREGYGYGYFIGPTTYCPAVNDIKYNLTFDYQGYLFRITKLDGTELQLHYSAGGGRKTYTPFQISEKDMCPRLQNEFTVVESSTVKGTYDVRTTEYFSDRFTSDVSDRKGCSSFKDYSVCVNNSKFSCIWVTRKDGKVVNSSSVLSNDAYCNVDNLQYVQCGGAYDIPVNVPTITSFVINFLKILTPIVLVFTSAITLLKAITANKEDEMNKAKDTLVRRIIIAALIFFVITITQFVIGRVADDSEAQELSSCFDCFINNSCEGNKYYKNNIDGEYQCFYVSDSTPFSDQSKCH